MKNFKKSFFVFYYIFVILKFIQCEINIDMESDNLLNPHSLYYDHKAKKMFNEDNRGVELQEIGNRNSIFCKKAEVYYRRLVTTILHNMHTSEDGEIVDGVVHFRGSKSQFETLKHYIRDDVFFSKADSILDDIILKPTIIEKSVYYVTSKLLDAIQFRLYEPWTICIACCTMILLCTFWMNWKFKRTKLKLFILVLEFGFITSYIMTYIHLVQEARIQQITAQMKFSKMPDSCQPEKMSLWQKFIANFGKSNECEEYVRSIEINPELQITPARVLMHLVSTVILHPVSVLGPTIATLIEDITKPLDSFTAYLMKPFLIIGVLIIILIILYFAIGGSFSYWSPFGRLSLHCNRADNEMPRINNPRYERIENIYEKTEKVPANRAMEKLNVPFPIDSNEYISNNGEDPDLSITLKQEKDQMTLKISKKLSLQKQPSSEKKESEINQITDLSNKCIDVKCEERENEKLKLEDGSGDN